MEGVPALIHQSEVSWDASLDPAAYYKIGQVFIRCSILFDSFSFSLLLMKCQCSAWHEPILISDCWGKSTPTWFCAWTHHLVTKRNSGMNCQYFSKLFLSLTFSCLLHCVLTLWFAPAWPSNRSTRICCWWPQFGRKPSSSPCGYRGFFPRLSFPILNPPFAVILGHDILRNQK